MKKKSKKSKSFIEKFNDRDTKGSIENTAIKSGVDIAASSLVGPGLCAITGKYAPMAGLALIAAGHYLGDKSGILRITGASTLAFGIAKAQEYRNNPELTTAGTRLKGLGNDLLAAFHIQWKEKQTNQKNAKTPESNEANTDAQEEELAELSLNHVAPLEGIEKKSDTTDYSENEDDDDEEDANEIDRIDNSDIDLSLI